jgi:SIR2-like domain
VAAPEQQLPAKLDRHLHLVLKAMREGRVVPFLGAGANLCGRHVDVEWQAGASPFLPSGRELADYLKREFLEESPVESNLLRVSQYVEVLVGADWLYDKLHELFAGTYAPTPLHEFLASVPERLFRRAASAPRYQLVVTTNYDDALEQAFDKAGERYHLVWYVAEGEEGERGKFMHRPPGGKPILIADPSEYVDVSTDECSVILKIHGAVDRLWPDSDRDSYVITEDDYIEYLTGGVTIASLVPVELANQLKRSHFLFLGYGLADWNLRVILSRIWRERRMPNVCWAIQKDRPSELDERFWEAKRVEILAVDLADYVAGLEERL